MIDYNQSVVGKQIAYYRNQSGLSQAKLAKLVGVSQSYIAELELGGKTDKSSVSMKNICKIAEVLNVSLNMLAGSNLEFPKIISENKLINQMAMELDCINLEHLIIFNRITAILAGKNKNEV